VKKFPWIFTSLWLIILAIMLWAGFWQLGRAEEKALINQKMSLKQIHQPVTEADWLSLSTFDQVSISGRFENVHFLLDNQIVDGKVGQFVFSAFQTSQSQWLLINRGWINSNEAVTNVQSSTLSINGMIADWPRPGVQLGEQDISDETMQNVTYLPLDKVKSMMTKRLCQNVTSNECIIIPLVVKLDPTAQYGFVRKWQLPRMTAEKHQAYATQWFTMSLVLCLIYGVFIRKTYINNSQDKTDASKN
jgi:cytochrome oxidase assembly protein ShyY1